MEQRTQMQKVADWNAKHPVGTEVQFNIGQTKVTDRKCATTTDAYLNKYQKATVQISTDGICDGLEIHLDHLKPITKGE